MNKQTCYYCKKEINPIYHTVVFGSGYKHCYDSDRIADMEVVKNDMPRM